jgi:hypothetical protein
MSKKNKINPFIKNMEILEDNNDLELYLNELKNGNLETVSFLIENIENVFFMEK